MTSLPAKTFYRRGMMDLTDYRLEPAVLDDRWDQFVGNSPQGSMFCQRVFLSALNGSFRPFYVLKNNELKAAFLLMETPGSRTDLHELVIHSGPMLAGADPQQNQAQALSEEFRVLSFIAAELPEQFAAVALSTHPDLSDLRPFLWHNYQSDGPKYKCELRYTAYLNIAGADRDCPLDQNPVYRLANKSRRQEIRYAAKAGVTTVEEIDLELFASFYEAVFERRGLTPEPTTKEVSGVMSSLSAAGLLRMFVSRTAEGQPGSIAVFGLDARRAYYLYGANDPALRDGHTGTAVLWDAFRALAADVSEVDLEGVNSPMRGYFKLSFGAELRPYHHVTLTARQEAHRQTVSREYDAPSQPSGRTHTVSSRPERKATITGIAARRILMEALLKSVPAEAGPVVIHSSLIDISLASTMSKWDWIFLLRTLLDKGYSLALPCFTFSFCRGEDFVSQAGRSETGLLGEWALSMPEFQRTEHPIYSFAVAGREATGWLSCANSTTFGEDSIFAAFARQNARMIMLGAGWEYCTFFHHLEELSQVPYRYFKDFEGKVDYGSGQSDRSVRMFVRDLEIAAENDFSALVDVMARQGISRAEKLLGASEVLSADCAEIAKAGLKLLAENPLALVGDSRTVEKTLRDRQKRESSPALSVSIVSSATIEPFAEQLGKDLADLITDQNIQITTTGFGQSIQDMINPDSDVIKSRPAFSFVINSLEDLTGNLGLADVERDVLLERVEQYCSAIELYRQRVDGWIFVHGFAPLQPGRTDLHRASADGRTIHRVANDLLEQRLSALESTRLIDMGEIAARNGPAIDSRLWHIGRLPYTPEFTRVLARIHAGLVLSGSGRTARLIVLDLDNTLWGGVLGEDGLEGLALGGDHPGNAFSEFQRNLKLLSESGIALAVCSKNDDQHAVDAMSALAEMHLRPDDLVSRRINWKPKYQNVIEICDELSLGPASVLFVDDNPVERQQMRQFLPDVKVLDLPDDPALYVQTLLDSPWLANLETTKEDKLRVENYQARRKTLELQASAENLDEFYMSLGSRVYLSPMTSVNRARAVQLVNKTNQFNTTTRRYDAHALERIDAEGGQVVVVGYEDRFSRLENIGVLIAKWSGMPEGVVEIDTYLLSCRILGRGIEQSILKYFAIRMAASGFSLIRGMIVETERNSPVRDIYASSGFSLSSVTGYWELPLPDPTLEIPAWVEVVDEFEEQN